MPARRQSLSMALLGWILLSERVTLMTVLAIAIALVGNVAALIAGSGFAAFSVALRWRHQEDSLPSVVIGGILATLGGAGVALALGQPQLAPLPDILWAVLAGAGTLAGGLILY